MHVYHVPNCAYMYILIKSSHVAYEFAIITFMTLTVTVSTSSQIGYSVHV